MIHSFAHLVLLAVVAASSVLAQASTKYMITATYDDAAKCKGIPYMLTISLDMQGMCMKSKQQCVMGLQVDCVDDYTQAVETLMKTSPYALMEQFGKTDCTGLIAGSAVLSDGTCHGKGVAAQKVTVASDGSILWQMFGQTGCEGVSRDVKVTADQIKTGACVGMAKYTPKNIGNKVPTVEDLDDGSPATNGTTTDGGKQSGGKSPQAAPTKESSASSLAKMTWISAVATSLWTAAW